MFNKTGNTNQTVTKFVTVVDLFSVNMCTKFGENWTIFRKII